MRYFFAIFLLVVWAGIALTQSSADVVQIKFQSGPERASSHLETASQSITAELITAMGVKTVELDLMPFQKGGFETRIVSSVDRQKVLTKMVSVYRGETEAGETVFAARKEGNYVAKIVNSSGEVQAFETEHSPAHRVGGVVEALKVLQVETNSDQSKCGVSSNGRATNTQSTNSSTVLSCISGSMSIYVDYYAFIEFGEDLARAQLWTLLGVAESTIHYANATDIDFELDIAELVINTCESCEVVGNPPSGVGILNALEDYDGFAFPQTFRVLITGRQVTNDISVVGVALVDQVCTPQSLAAVEVQTDNYLDLGLIITHEIGHVLGMVHDDVGEYFMSPALNYAQEWSQATLTQLRTVAARESCWETCGYSPAFPAFALSSISIEEGQTFEPIDESLGAVVAWQWLAPGSAPYDTFSQTPLFRYDTEGTYEVMLRVRDLERGWTDFTPVQFIEVTPRVSIEITCIQEGDSLAVAVNPKGIDEIRWSFSGIINSGLHRPIGQIQLDRIDTARIFQLSGKPDAEVVVKGYKLDGRSVEKLVHSGCQYSYGAKPKLRDNIGLLKTCERNDLFSPAQYFEGRVQNQNQSFLLDKYGRAYDPAFTRRPGLYDVHWIGSNYHGVLDTIVEDQLQIDLEHGMAIKCEASGSLYKFTVLLPFDATGVDDTYHWTFPDGTTVITDEPTVTHEFSIPRAWDTEVVVERFVSGCTTEKRSTASIETRLPVPDVSISLTTDAKPMNCAGDTITAWATVEGSGQIVITNWLVASNQLQPIYEDENKMIAIILENDNDELIIGYEVVGEGRVRQLTDFFHVASSRNAYQASVGQIGLGISSKPFIVELDGSPYDLGGRLRWSFDGVPHPDSHLDFYEFDSSGLHTVDLINEGFCVNARSTLEVELPMAQTIVTSAPFMDLDRTTYCPYDDINLSVDVSGYAHCEWTLPGAVKSSLVGDFVTVQYPEKGTFQTSVTVYDLEGRTTTLAGPTINIGPHEYAFEVTSNENRNLILRDNVLDHYRNDYKWYSGDGAFYKAEGLPFVRHRPIVEGFLNVRFQVDTRCGRFESLTRIDPDQVVPTNQVPDQQAAVYPNPTRSRLYVKLNKFTKPDLNFIIFDALGRSVAQGQLENSDISILELTEFNLTDGLYHLVLGQGDSSSAVQFVVSK